jgi:hypothetical protein
MDGMVPRADVAELEDRAARLTRENAGLLQARRVFLVLSSLSSLLIVSSLSSLLIVSSLSSLLIVSSLSSLLIVSSLSSLSSLLIVLSRLSFLIVLSRLSLWSGSSPGSRAARLGNGGWAGVGARRAG